MSLASLLDSQEEDRRKVGWALLASVIFHLLLILVLAFFLSATFFSRDLPPVEEEEPIEFTIVAPPEPQSKEAPYIDTTAAQEVAKPPDAAYFQSDKDTAAASEKPASGTAPVPTQDGENRDALDFQNQENTAGPQARPSTPQAQPAQPVQAAAPPQPEPQPTPEPVATPQPEPQPRTTTQLALLEPPKPKNTPRPETQKPVQQQPPAQAQPAQQSLPPGYQPQTRVTRVEGNISNRGRSSVAALATPLGRYTKMVNDAIGSRWYFYVRQRMDLYQTGVVRISFTVLSSGKVTQVKVTGNTSNESFASCCVGAIVEAELPPIPPDLASTLEGGRIEFTSFTFSLY